MDANVSRRWKPYRRQPHLHSGAKGAAREFYRQWPGSRICGSTDADILPLKEEMGSICGRYDMFAHLKNVSFYLLLFSVFSIVFIALLAGISTASQSAQYKTFVTGYTFAKVASVIQVLAQGAILLALLFYATVLWTNHYYPKLLMMAGFAILAAAYGIFKVILSKIDTTLELDENVTHRLGREEGEKLFKKISELCEKSKTAPPDNVLLGIDDNFFVTESPVRLGGEILTGRTLYLSLFQLKNLTREEAEAILCHEMAHFSGDDTLFSKQTSPLIQKVNGFMDVLHASTLTLPVFYFMQFFMGVFFVSFQKISREREHRADRAARTVAQALITGLIK